MNTTNNAEICAFRDASCCNVCRYRHIIWDWNGTLLDDVAQCVDVLNIMMARRNLPSVDISKYRSLFDFPVIKFYERLGFDFVRETFAAVADEYMVLYTSRLPAFSLHKNIPVILKQLSDMGVSHSIVSAYQQDRLNEAVTALGVSEFFVRLFGADNHFAHSKLSIGKQWIAQLKHMNYPADSILFIGDTVHDYEVASAMQIDCLLISSGHQDKKRLTTCSVPVYDSITDAMEAIL